MAQAQETHPFGQCYGCAGHAIVAIVQAVFRCATTVLSLGWIYGDLAMFDGRNVSRCGAAGPPVIVLRMRNRKVQTKDFGAVGRGDWAEFIRLIETATGMVGRSGPLGRMVGVPYGTWWRWRNGKQKPTDLDKLYSVAAAFDIDVEIVMWAAGQTPKSVPAPVPLSKVELRIKVLGLSKDDEVVSFILDQQLPDGVKIALIEGYHVRRQGFIQSEVTWAKFSSGQLPVLAGTAGEGES